MGKKSRWGVIFDAGSSGTRMYIYKWKDATKVIKDATPEELKTLPHLKLQKSQKIRPGVSSFADRPADIGPGHLQSLIDVALDEIPSHKIPDTPIFLMATAGMRLLELDKQKTLLGEMCDYIQQNTRFYLPDCGTHIQVIPGETEGLYGWIGANYLLGGFDHAELNDHGKGHHTYGFLDMGGASAQIAFAPNATETAKHSDDLKLVRMRNLDGSPHEYKVFTATFLGFGANMARQRYVQKLEDQYGTASGGELPDPCMPRGLRTSPTGDLVSPTDSTESMVLVGTGKFPECVSQTYPLLGKDAVCEDSPCLLNGQHVPAIDFDVNHFVGVSEFWHTTHGVFGKDGGKAYDLVTYQKAVSDFCSQDWDSIQAEIQPRKKDTAQKARDAQEACFKASWLINVLYDGIGIPRIGFDSPTGPALNTSRTAAGKAGKAGKSQDDHGLGGPFQPVDKIDGVEVSWTLGKMVLYAAGQIPPKSSSALPVGFGSNEAGIPADFEHAGSSHHRFGPDGDEEGDDWGDTADELIGKARSNATASLFGLFAFALIIGFLVLRKRERRLWLCGKFGSTTRRRRSPRKGRGFSLTTTFFGRNSTAYERVLEEGLGDEFDLAEVDSDDSDGSEASRAGISSGLLTPNIKPDRFDDARSGAAIDRHGLVIRTESRERLAPSIQMLNAGRRSRAASPTRLKSPLMMPLRED